MRLSAEAIRRNQARDDGLARGRFVPMAQAGPSGRHAERPRRGARGLAVAVQADRVRQEPRGAAQPARRARPLAGRPHHVPPAGGRGVSERVYFEDVEVGQTHRFGHYEVTARGDRRVRPAVRPPAVSPGRGRSEAEHLRRAHRERLAYGRHVHPHDLSITRSPARPPPAPSASTTSSGSSRCDPATSSRSRLASRRRSTRRVGTGSGTVKIESRS